MLKQAKANKYVDKLSSKVHNELKSQEKADESDFDEEEALYQGDPLEKAQEILEHEKKQVSKTPAGPNKSPKLKKKKKLDAQKESNGGAQQQSNGIDHSAKNGGQQKLKKKKKQGKKSDSNQQVLAKKKALNAKIKAKRKQKTSVNNDE